MKIGDRFVLRHLGDEVVLTRFIGEGRVVVSFWPLYQTHLIVTAAKSLVAVS
jgi:hypothetical protein